MVNDTIEKRRGTDLPPLGLMDVEMGIGPGRIPVSAQIRLQLEQAVGEAMLERGDIGVAAFAACRLAVGPQQVAPGTDPGVGFTA